MELFELKSSLEFSTNLGGRSESSLLAERETMNRFQNILVAVDTRFEKHPALEWAARLAEHNQAKLKIVEVLPEFSWIQRRDD